MKVLTVNWAARKKFRNCCFTIVKIIFFTSNDYRRMKNSFSCRLWSKKYPICLRIPNNKGAVLSPGNSAAKKDKFVPRIDENNEIIIYLFSRTDRDKSVWFSRFLKASRAKIERPHSPTLSCRMTEQSFENKRTLSVDFAQLQCGLSEEGEDEVYIKK